MTRHMFLAGLERMPYWHRVAAPITFYDTVHMHQGKLRSPSLTSGEPDGPGCDPPDPGREGAEAREALFEEVRRARFPGLPSRLSALFVFDDYGVAQRARIERWAGEGALHECRALPGAVTHRADGRWLEGRPGDWRTNADSYWRGTMSPDPLPEVIVHGILYFPGSESFPTAQDFLGLRRA